MKHELALSYQRGILRLFRETKKHFGSTAFGAESNVISMTIPLMTLENWRENGHQNDIPLLDECTGNVILALAATMFGWKKTAYLHLRVALESVFYGTSIIKNRSQFKKFQTNGIIPYTKFNHLVTEFPKFSSLARAIDRKFSLHGEAKTLYTRLSEWTHTLGSQYCINLLNFGRTQLAGKDIGELKQSFKQISKCACIVYLTIRPSILGELNLSHQRYLLQVLSLLERRQLREILNI